MKPPRPLHFLACLLSLCGLWAFFFFLRPAEPSAPSAARATAPAPAPKPVVAERRAIGPTPLLAAPAPAVGEDSPWVALNNQAATLLTEGDLAGAVALFERCLEAEKENAVYAGNLAEALVRLALQEHERGELAPAVEHLARALDLHVAREDQAVLVSLLERWRRELELQADDWTDDSSRFELSYDGDRTELLHHSHEVLEHLERCYDELVRWFGQDPFPNGPAIRVVLYQPADFDRLTGLGDWAAGVFDGVVRVSLKHLENDTTWRAVLAHELVHALVQELGGPGVPGWLNEGLAQLLEGRPEAVARLGPRLRGETLFPLERLTGSLAGWDDTTAIAQAYAESLVFVDYLRENYGDEALRRMVLGAHRGESPAVSFRAYASVELEVVFQDWSDAIRR